MGEVNGIVGILLALEETYKGVERIALADVLLGFEGRSSYESDKEIYKQVRPFEKDI
jgi:hypothetical protein